MEKDTDRLPNISEAELRILWYIKGDLNKKYALINKKSKNFYMYSIDSQYLFRVAVFYGNLLQFTENPHWKARYETT